MTAACSTPDNISIFQALATEIGLDTSPFKKNVSIKGQDPVVPSTHRLGDACAAALAVTGVAVSQLSHARGGPLDSVNVSVEEAIMQLTAAFYTKVNNVSLLRLFEDPKLFGNSTFYPTKDGRHFFLLLTYPHLRDAACQVLQSPPEKEDYTKRILDWDAFELEEAINKAGGCGVALRSREEWRQHPQGKALTGKSVVSIEKIGNTDPIPLSHLSSGSALPLENIRFLDNGHVIAAPMTARFAAELGADVLHISSPDHTDFPAMLNETGLGKLNAFCDLNDEEDRQKFSNVLKKSDVYICNYRSLEKKGYSAKELAAIRPGIIFIDITGWGREGPWATRGGFDQLACTASGFSSEEGSWTSPQLPPTYLLNDYLAALLGLAGSISALLRRSKEGGSYVVNLNLASVVMWVQDLGGFSQEEIQHLSPIDHSAAKDKLSIVAGPNGKTEHLGIRILFDSIRPFLKRGGEPAGASELSWDEFKQK